MNQFAILTSAFTRSLPVAAIAISLAPVAIIQESKAQQVQPVVVRVKNLKGGKKMPIDWRVDPVKQRDFNQYVVPNDPALKGARIFQAEARSNDLVDVLQRALAFDGFESIKIMGNVPLKNVQAFDRGGKGSAFSGQAVLNGQRYRFSAVGLYMTFNRNPRFTTHSIFAAPEDVSVRMGGFIPVSSTYFDLDGDKVKDLILQAGQFDPKLQASHLARATDTYISKVSRAVNAPKSSPGVYPGYPGLVYDGPCTGLEGTDPDAYGITGLGNPDC